MVNSNGLRVALVGPLPPPSGGMANQTRQLSQLLSQEGIEVDLVQTNSPYRPAWIASLQGIRAIFRLLPYLCQLWSAAGRADVVHVMANSGWSWHLFAAPAVWIASARKVPVVMNYRGGEAETFFQSAYRWVAPTLARVACVMVPTGFLAEIFDRRGVSTQIIPNIVNTERFQGGASDTGSGHHIVVTRNLEAIYDIATAIRAFQTLYTQLPGARMSIAGSGPDRAMLESLATKLGLGDSIIFTGRLDVEAMVSLYASADVMLNPSLADNMPNSVLESLASGVPVVSTNVGGVPFLVEDGVTALLVDTGDHQAMADAMTQLLTDVTLRDTMIAAGRELVEQYTWTNVRELLLPLYRRLAEAGS
ncbi:MAG TPA: glycosyltransferase family 1 protein [Chromatiaceae bacterium]|nr:glycosyltransferase family 1 protein [Chromatiaceae bacterium]HIB84541.1 glycosyltransferase family 1 protein [Chromatiaceae bacterium]HIO13613.1 glycosyltransferase family 1 protein [Chromatiales bacterium]